MRLLIKKVKKGSHSREIIYKHFNESDAWPEIYVEVAENDYIGDVIEIPLDTLIKLWEATMRKKDIDGYVDNFDMKGDK